MSEHFYRSSEAGFAPAKFNDDLSIFVVHKSFYIVLCDNHNVTSALSGNELSKQYILYTYTLHFYCTPKSGLILFSDIIDYFLGLN